LLPAHICRAPHADSHAKLTRLWPTDLGSPAQHFHSAQQHVARRGPVMWLPPPPPSAWMTKPSRTPPVFASESARSLPLATPGRALAVIQWKTTTLYAPMAATAQRSRAKAPLQQRGSAAGIHRPPGRFLQLQGAVFSACALHPQPPPSTRGLPLQPMPRPWSGACRCPVHPSLHSFEPPLRESHPWRCCRSAGV
jgi:hypothetical protein